MADKQTAEQRFNPETAPDPDEDDLSDLDDMLDDFSTTTLKDTKPTNPAPATAAPPKPASAPQASTEDDDFAKELQAGMASLLGQFDQNPDMQKQFEEMMKELSTAAAAAEEPNATPATTVPPPATTKAAQPSASSSTKKPAESSFQDTIRKTMERMQNSGETASAAAAGAGSEEDMLAQMLKEMEGGGFGGGSEEDLNKMLMGMMEQLTNKDILYDPMKELHDKFPAWLSSNKDKCSKEDLARYEEQKKVVDEIVARFERKEYSDESTEDREYIVERMQKMQAAGSPPPDLVGDMSAAQEALGDLDAGCQQQ
ncbi:hypothetical protein AAFC00_003769 [Neodothiora populina]|uniref:Pex19-domain-containing protein n=1 Tax=Neodothiora populina TaxID=2781224 RepID=A0ABR3PFF7_9PEZI